MLLFAWALCKSAVERGSRHRGRPLHAALLVRCGAGLAVNVAERGQRARGAALEGPWPAGAHEALARRLGDKFAWSWLERRP